MMIANGLFTITCFLFIKDYKGAGIEVINALVPISLLIIGYPKDLIDLVMKSN